MCKSLLNIIIPKGVTSIGHSAFYDCDCLTNITIHENIANIDKNAFIGCDNLASVIFENTTGWERYSNAYFADGTEIIGLDNPTTAVQYLREANYYWKRG